ncbi:facilitated trehalose transporter Tret1 isoform X2 [Prorops nasuta]
MDSGEQTKIGSIGTSQQTLVSTGSTTVARGNRVPQYVASLASTLGALAAGMVLAWTSPAGKEGIKLAANYGIPITKQQFSLIGSLTTLGAAAVCMPIGVLADLIGRKTAMLILVVPFTIGWLLIIFANSIGMFYAGRFITGLSGGAFCVTAPMYTAEIVESEIRGSLGSYFQLLLTTGILLTYIIGYVLNNMHTLSIISAIFPLVFFVAFFFMPESPVYYLKKNRENEARDSLLKLRGDQYDVDTEIRNLQASLNESRGAAFSTAILSKPAIKGLIIAFGLMVFQQLSGVNAIIFYLGKIASSVYENDESSQGMFIVVVGVIQVVAVLISTLIVDRLGRRMLLLTSSSAMCAAMLILGVCFYLKEHQLASQDVTGTLSLIMICTFIVLFSFGFGPIPWMMMGEIFAPEIKGVAASSACCFNWMVAFIVTYFFDDITGTVKDSGAFWIFSGVCGIGVVFVFFVVPETKDKSLDDIQRELAR